MSWLKPYLRVWYAAYPDSVAPTRQLAHYVKPLLEHHAEDRIVQELAAYLEKTPPQFVNLHRFAATFGSWARAQPKTPPPATVKRVAVQDGERMRLVEVPIDDPRPAA